MLREQASSKRFDAAPIAHLELVVADGVLQRLVPLAHELVDRLAAVEKRSADTITPWKLSAQAVARAHQAGEIGAYLRLYTVPITSFLLELKKPLSCSVALVHRPMW